MTLLHDGASRKRDIGMAGAAPQYDRPSLGETVRLTNVSALGTRKSIRPPQVLKVSCACWIIGEYPLEFRERRRETTGIHGRNLASECLIGNKPDRQDFIYLATNHIAQHMIPDKLDPGLHEVACVIKRMPLLPRTYAIRVGISVGEKRNTAFYVENALIFRVNSDHLNRVDPDISEGFVALETRWQVIEPINQQTANPGAALSALEAR